jgi:hypothetical protein
MNDPEDDFDPTDQIDLSHLRGPVAPGSSMACAIGDVVIAVNGTQEAVLALFETLSGLRDEAAQAVFKSIKSDSTQRLMTQELARVRLSRHPHLLQEAIRCLTECRKIAEKRNAAIHTAWEEEVETGNVRPSDQTVKHNPFVMDRKVEDNLNSLSQQCRRTADDIYALCNTIQDDIGCRLDV